MTAFDNNDLENYRSEVQERWGETEAYREHKEKTKNYSKQQWNDLTAGLDGIMGEFALCKEKDEAPDSPQVQTLVQKLRAYITDHYYLCTKEILSGLGKMYVLDDRFKNNIDKHTPGTADLISKAIQVYCQK